jgi:hypothetical protein
MSKIAKQAIVFNVLMSLLIVVVNELILVGLQRQSIWLSIFYIEHQPYGVPPVPTSTAPLPNFPVFIFVIQIAVNLYIILKLTRSKETKQNPA